jgi:hypothetical protein
MVADLVLADDVKVVVAPSVPSHRCQAQKPLDAAASSRISVHPVSALMVAEVVPFPMMRRKRLPAAPDGRFTTWLVPAVVVADSAGVPTTAIATLFSQLSRDPGEALTQPGRVPLSLRLRAA